MLRRCWPLLFLLIALVACGSTPAATPGADVAATQTRTVELGVLATALAPTATGAPLPTPTPGVAATQTRIAEVNQLATLTAPTPTPLPPSATAPGTPRGDAPSRATAVGRLEASKGLIGISVDGSDVIAYVCDGAGLSQWFTGKTRENRLDLTAPSGARLEADISSAPGGGKLQAANGTFRSSSGEVSKFTSTATDGAGKAGLYRSTGTVAGRNLTMGVVVLPDGELRGILQADQYLLPVTEPTFAPTSLTATFPEFGPITAQRLGAQ